MRVPKVTELVREEAEFMRFQDGMLWYQITYKVEDPVTGYGSFAKFDFPIAVNGSDAGGTFESNERGITLMRWIRKQVELLNAAQAETEASG